MMLSPPTQERPDEALLADAGALLAAFPATKAQLPRVKAAFRRAWAMRAAPDCHQLA